jgi:hypothetical protein
VLRIFWVITIAIFVLSFVNIGTHVFGHRGLACILGVMFSNHFAYFHTRKKIRHRRAILLLLCLQNTPYRLHEISLREASKTASQRKIISFVCQFRYLWATSHFSLRPRMSFPILSVQFTEDSVMDLAYGRVGFVTSGEAHCCCLRRYFWSRFVLLFCVGGRSWILLSEQWKEALFHGRARG